MLETTPVTSALTRESGTPLFKDGTITGATTGIEVGGAFAAGHFQDVDIVGPTQSGLEVVGQVAATLDGLTVSDGNYGVLVSNTASGQMDLENLDLSDQVVAGVLYQANLGGDVTGTISTLQVQRSSTPAEPLLMSNSVE